MIDVRGVGLEAMRSAFKRDLAYFQADQLKAMRKATRVLRNETTRILRSGSPLRKGTGRKRKDVPGLFRAIVTKNRKTKTNVIGIVRYHPRRGFYGKMHELGVQTIMRRRVTRPVVVIGGRFVTLSRRLKKPRVIEFAFRLPARPVLGPVARRKMAAAVDILGSSYGVFTKGSRV